MAIALVSQVNVAVAGGAGGTSSAIDTTGTTLLVVSVGWYWPGGTVTLNDSKSNTWTALTSHGSGNANHRIMYCLSPTVGSGHTFTLGGGTVYPSAIVYAFSGVSSYQTESGAGSETSPIATGSVTPSADGAMIFTGREGNGASIDSISGGFTTTTVANSGGNYVQNSAGYLVQTTAAAINPTWSWTGSPIWNGASTAVFLATVMAATGASSFAFLQ